MRRIALFGAIFAVIANPGLVVTTTAATKTQTTGTIAMRIDLNSPTALTVDAPKTDFTTEFVIPAHQKLAEREQADLSAKLAAAGLNPAFAAQYVKAQQMTGTPAQLLAAVHLVETHQSGDTLEGSSAGAMGPMQFMPGTFAAYATDGNGDGTAYIGNADDAIATAGHYLAKSGADRGDYFGALLNYNHSTAYANHVLAIAQQLGL